MMTLGADLAPKENVGEFLSFWRLIGDGGQMGAPMIVGRIADMVGLSPAAFVIAGIGLAASGIFLFFVPETLQKPPPQPSPSQNKHPT
jgi:MFS family permease